MASCNGPYSYLYTQMDKITDTDTFTNSSTPEYQQEKDFPSSPEPNGKKHALDVKSTNFKLN